MTLRYSCVSESWKSQFLTLEANVAPFREQLDKYHMERETLLQEKAMTVKVRLSRRGCKNIWPYERHLSRMGGLGK